MKARSKCPNLQQRQCFIWCDRLHAFAALNVSVSHACARCSERSLELLPAVLMLQRVRSTTAHVSSCMCAELINFELSASRDEISYCELLMHFCCRQVPRSHVLTSLRRKRILSGFCHINLLCCTRYYGRSQQTSVSSRTSRCLH